MDTSRRTRVEHRKRVYYLSLEFLIGRLLREILHNLGVTELYRAALGDLGVDLERMRVAEPDAALGNGGLGRLAACFMESMATLSIPACGYGIRYDHGLFRQVIKNGEQQEYPENWLAFGNPWEFARPEVIYDVYFGGSVETIQTKTGGAPRRLASGRDGAAVAYDTPMVGWRGRHVNPLRLWSARAVDPLRLDVFNGGDHVGALSEQARAEAISKVLYPSDATAAGQELRLRQEYFFVSASLQDLVRRHVRVYGDIRSLPDKAADPAERHASEHRRGRADAHPRRPARAGLGRGLGHHRPHALLHQPHAAAGGAGDLAGAALRAACCRATCRSSTRSTRATSIRCARAGLASDEFLASVSLIDERHGRRVRMGHLAFLGSHRVNGVSALHTDLMRQTVFSDLHRLYPDRIVNKTNGITFRRWLHQANPGLTQLARGDLRRSACSTTPTRSRSSADSADDPALQEEVAAVRHANKVTLARVIRDRLDIRVDPSALFDVQIKRIHEYKRQLLNLLETIALYQAIRDEPNKRLGAARKNLRRQGGGDLQPGEAHHPARQRHRQGRQRRPGGARPAQGGVPAELQCQPGRSDHPGRRPLRADLDRRHGSLGHRQHEARAERRAHHRHARRRQYRDPRARRPGEHLHLRADGRRRSRERHRSGFNSSAAIAASPRLARRSTRFRPAPSRRSRSTATARSSSRSATTTASW